MSSGQMKTLKTISYFVSPWENLLLMVIDTENIIIFMDYAWIGSFVFFGIGIYSNWSDIISTTWIEKSSGLSLMVFEAFRLILLSIDRLCILSCLLYRRLALADSQPQLYQSSSKPPGSPKITTHFSTKYSVNVFSRSYGLGIMNNFLSFFLIALCQADELYRICSHSRRPNISCLK